ncbi:hypothetical protein BT96DRAFT_659772 [Gymnopus androsaceus JB14]|uniref:Uncharacterized protein n=1 Tax=Gymnopus androsaceus JB14 TaxID=1447944 RepID=A0A6A4GFJ1_9AGAR|nr:hypothetical protein BT96DRAFT_659772 [Gymnopus androsaceus JB14]
MLSRSLKASEFRIPILRTRKSLLFLPPPLPPMLAGQQYGLKLNVVWPLRGVFLPLLKLRPFLYFHRLLIQGGVVMVYWCLGYWESRYWLYKRRRTNETETREIKESGYTFIYLLLRSLYIASIYLSIPEYFQCRRPLQLPMPRNAPRLAIFPSFIPYIYI